MADTEQEQRETAATKLANELGKRNDEYDELATAYLKLHAKHEKLEADYAELLAENDRLYDLAEEFEDDEDTD